MTTLPVPIFPTLPLHGFSVHKKPTFASLVQTPPSGREVTGRQLVYPLWEFELTYEVLRDQTQNESPLAPTDGFTELQNLTAFVMGRTGQFGTFVYQDPDDFSRTAQFIDTGNGVKVSFSMVRTFGNNTLYLIEPVGMVDVRDGVTLNIYLDGVPLTQTENWWIDIDLQTLKFTNAPGNGVVITADFSFFYFCRFIEDSMELEEFNTGRWLVKSLKFRSTRPDPPVTNALYSSGGYTFLDIHQPLIIPQIPISTGWVRILTAASFESEGFYDVKQNSGADFIVAQTVNLTPAHNVVTLFLSSDSGTSFTTKEVGLVCSGASLSTTGSNGGLAMSWDASRIYVAAPFQQSPPGYKLYSSTDRGGSFSPIPLPYSGPLYYPYVACDSTGTMLIAAIGETGDGVSPPANLHPFVSGNSGVTWFQATPYPSHSGPGAWAVGMSGDGSTMLAYWTYFNGGPFLSSELWISRNRGLTWNFIGNPLGGGNWGRTGIAVSGNGNVIYVGGNLRGIAVSTDGGVTWSHPSAFPFGSRPWGVGCSSSGVAAVAGKTTTQLQFTVDTGVNWTIPTLLGVNSFLGATSVTPDGRIMLGADSFVTGISSVNAYGIWRSQAP